MISLVGGNSGISIDVAASTYLSGYEKKITNFQLSHFLNILIIQPRS